jgi:hypothetical protein
VAPPPAQLCIRRPDVRLAPEATLGLPLFINNRIDPEFAASRAISRLTAPSDLDE